MSPFLIVSMHDVAPATFEENCRWLEMLERVGVRASLLVIPGPWRGKELVVDSELHCWLAEAHQRGHEVVLHGWEHTAVIDRSDPGGAFERARATVRARGCAEFSGLGTTAARHRIERGQAALRSLGFDPIGFIAPGWLMRSSTLPVLRDLGFRYTTTQWTVTDLMDGTEHRIPSTAQRPGSALSGVAARINVSVARTFAAAQRSLRIALHPDDRAHRLLVGSAERAIEGALLAGFRSVTYKGFLGGMPAASRMDVES